jgi:hypothetical protein
LIFWIGKGEDEELWGEEEGRSSGCGEFSCENKVGSSGFAVDGGVVKKVSLEN